MPSYIFLQTQIQTNCWMKKEIDKSPKFEERTEI